MSSLLLGVDGGNTKTVAVVVTGEGEVLGRCHGGGIDVIPAKPLPRHVRGLVEMLGEYQALAAETAWRGTRTDAIRALSANPLVRQVEVAVRVYDALASAHRDYLPERLLA